MSSPPSIASSGSRASSNGFLSSVKDEIRKRSNQRCWCCGSVKVQVCHVSPFQDNGVDALEQKGLKNYMINGLENGIALCPSCHYAFDDLLDPGLIIVPEDLDYFIRFEEEDYKRRQEAARNGVSAPRMCPSSDAYCDHQVRQGKIQEGSPGGLYRVIQTMPYGVMVGSDDLRPWTGAPMAMIRRAFVTFQGSIRDVENDIQHYVESRLLQLKRLYRRPPSEVQNVMTVSTPQLTSGAPSCPNEDSCEDMLRRSPRKQRRLNSNPPNIAGVPSKKTNVPSDQIPFRTMDPYHRTESWILGPGSCAQDAIECFGVHYERHDQQGP